MTAAAQLSALGNGPAFSAYPSGVQTVSHNSETKVLFGTEVFDTNSCFASSTFTPTVAGYYQVNTCVYFQVNDNREYYLSSRIKKNGSTYVGVGTVSTQDSGQGRAINCNAGAVVYLNGTTDYVEVYAFDYDYTSSGSVDLSAAAGYTCFSGALVRAA